MRPAALLWLVIALAATACTPPLPGAQVQVSSGIVERLDDGEWVAVTRVEDGQHIRAAADVVLDFDGGVIRMRRGSKAMIGQRTLTLTVGDALAEGDGLVLGVQDTTVRGSGAFRLQAGVVPRVAVYTGEVQVVRPGEGQRVAGLRELGLSIRRFDGTDSPLSYDEADPVDQRMVPGAIAFDAQIRNLVNAIDTQFGPQPQQADFYTSFVSVSPPDLQALTSTAPIIAPDGAVGPPADALIGLFLARALADVRDGDLLQAGTDIRRLREEGARWGLVALALGVTSVDFAGIVDQAVERREEVALAPPAPPEPQPAPAPPAPAAPLDPAPAPAPLDPAPAPAEAPPPVEPPAPPDIDPGTVQTLLDDLLGDVLEIVPDPLGLLGPD